MAVVPAIQSDTNLSKDVKMRQNQKNKKNSVGEGEIINILSSECKAFKSFKVKLKMRKKQQLWPHSKTQKMPLFHLFICRNHNNNNHTVNVLSFWIKVTDHDEGSTPKCV